MRDWRVRRPAAGWAVPVDWSAPESPPPPKPDRIPAPWGQTFDQYSDGYFRVAPADPPLSAGALHDRIERFLRRWTVAAPGVCYHVHGDRLAILWRNRDGTYRSGHVGLVGPREGVWLIERGSCKQAATRVELWWLGSGRLPRGPRARVSPAAVAARLGLPATRTSRSHPDRDA